MVGGLRDRFLFARVDWVMSPSPGDALFCCALKKAGGYRKYTGKHRTARTGSYLLLLWPAFNHIRRGGILVFSHNQEGCLWALLITRKLRYPHALSAALRRRRKSLGSSRTKVSLVDVELLSMSTAASLLPKSGRLRTS